MRRGPSTVCSPCTDPSERDQLHVCLRALPSPFNLTVTASGCAQASYVENLKALDAACGDDIRVSLVLLDVARA